jgi:6-phosphofructokinase 1
VVANFRALGLDALVCVGGDGTMIIAHGLAQKGVPLVGVPKTIDNDLLATDFTFGFDTALHTAVDAIDKLHTTAESHERVMFLEVMGRHAGWIAIHAGIAGGADVILLPEIPYAVEAIAAKIQHRRATWRPFSIVVVAEGARPVGGIESYLGERRLGEAVRLGGAAARVARELAALIETEHRVTVLGHLQRGGSPSPFDRLLATRFGTAAVELLARGQFDHMVCLRTPHITAAPIAEAIARRNLVDPAGELCQTARAIGISLGSPEEVWA